jgi:hypothetical protein
MDGQVRMLEGTHRGAARVGRGGAPIARGAFASRQPLVTRLGAHYDPDTELTQVDGEERAIGDLLAARGGRARG